MTDLLVASVSVSSTGSTTEQCSARRATSAQLQMEVSASQGCPLLAQATQPADHQGFTEPPRPEPVSQEEWNAFEAMGDRSSGNALPTEDTVRMSGGRRP